MFSSKRQTFPDGPDSYLKIVVTDDLERTASAYKKLFGTGTAPAEMERHIRKEPYTLYLGQPLADTPMKVESVFSDNFWFEIIQPLGDHDPWARWLKDHGTSVCSVCLLSDGPIEADEACMAQAGYESIFKQERDMRRMSTSTPRQILAYW